MLVQHFLEHSAERFPDKTALVGGHRRLSYAQFEAQANALAHGLADGGLQPGERVVICLPNCPEAAVAVFGTLKAAGVFVFLNPTIKEQKLKYILNHCRATALICGDAHATICTRSPGDYPTVRRIIAVGSAGSGSPQPAPPALLRFQKCVSRGAAGKLPCPTRPEHIACILYTSGSTGEPKGVVCGHDNVSFASGSIIRYLNNTPDDVVINVLPLSFDYGLYQLLMTTRFGGTLVLEPAFVYPDRLLARIEAEKVSGLPLVPTLLALLLRSSWQPERLRSLRYITNTAAALAQRHIRAVRERLPWVTFYSMYGLTECKRALYLPPEQIDLRPDSVGIAIPGTEVWLEDEVGRRVDPPGSGELVIRGPHVMRGYWEDPRSTAEVFAGGPEPESRTLRSGDLFRTDQEGYLHFLSRKDDVIKSRGEKVSPREIEDAAYSLEGVLEAAAIGVPDPILGQKIKLFVASGDPSVNAQSVMRRCRERLEAHVIPQVVEIRRSLPKTDSGKIDKKSLA